MLVYVLVNEWDGEDTFGEVETSIQVFDSLEKAQKHMKDDYEDRLSFVEEGDYDIHNTSASIVDFTGDMRYSWEIIPTDIK